MSWQRKCRFESPHSFQYPTFHEHEGTIRVIVLDLLSDFTNPDGTIKKDLFKPDNIHLSPASYAVYASKLNPMIGRR